MKKTEPTPSPVLPAGRPLQKRAAWAVGLLCVAACVISFYGNIATRVVPQSGAPAYYFGPSFPPGAVAGHDFWVTYTYAKILCHGGDIHHLPSDIPEKMRGYFSGARNVSTYPPLIFLIYTPFLLMSYDHAYWVLMFLLCLLNVGVVGLVVKMFRGALDSDTVIGEQAGKLQYSVMAGLAFIAVSSYGFFFSIERGNCDALAMAMCWGFLWVLLEKPKMIWLPAFLLACAVHIKITPAVLAILLLWRHGWKSMVPLCVWGVALLFVWGSDNAVVFLDALRSFSSTPDGWWGDHSAYSFAFTVLKPAGLPLALCEKGIIAFSALLWGTAFFVLWRRGATKVNMILMCAISFPLMLMAPSTSNDYKLVILYAPVAVFVLGWMWGYVRQGSLPCLVAIIAQLLILCGLSVSGGLIREPWGMNKLPLVLMTQCLMFVTIMIPPDVFREKVA